MEGKLIFGPILFPKKNAKKIQTFDLNTELLFFPYIGDITRAPYIIKQNKHCLTYHCRVPKRHFQAHEGIFVNKSKVFVSYLNKLNHISDTAMHTVLVISKLKK